MADKMYTHRGNNLPAFAVHAGATLVAVWQVPYFWIYADVLGNKLRNKGGRGVSFGGVENKGVETILADSIAVSRFTVPSRRFYAIRFP